MQQYLDLVEYVLHNGEESADRTGVGTISVFGPQTTYDLRDGFPMVTTKKVLFDSVVAELLWFLRGDTNINGLKYKDKQVHIWDAWADEYGNVGPVYGEQWRSWQSDHADLGYIDQIEEVIKGIKDNPRSRRHIVSAWNVGDLKFMKLPPCHLLFQFYVSNGFLDLKLFQRSADLALGVPFNIASYALLLSMVANECGLTPRKFIHTFGDLHIYSNHVDGLKRQLTRDTLPLSQLKLTPGKPVLEMTEDDIELVGYKHHPFIKFEVAV